jgi:membrane protein DedA with SNARE-associated domain
VARATRGHEATWERTQRLFRRFGGWLLAFGYFIPGVRHVTAIAAGTTPLGFRSFSAWAYPGAVLWSTTFVALGYYAGDRWKEMFDAARGWPLAIAGVVAVAFAMTRREALG